MPNPVAVPLVERLQKVPVSARLILESPNHAGSELFSTTVIPVGVMCSEAVNELRAAAAREKRLMTTLVWVTGRFTSARQPADWTHDERAAVSEVEALTGKKFVQPEEPAEEF